MTTQVKTSLREILDWVKLDQGPRWIYRGQSNARWTIAPRVARESLIDPEKVERLSLDEFKRCGLRLTTFEPRNPLEWMALAQHHGLRTRLLDWTRNPLVALWFAVCVQENKADASRLFAARTNRSIELGGEQREGCFKEPFSERSIVVIDPPIIAERIRMQQGCFTLHPYSSDEGFAAIDQKMYVDAVDIPVKYHSEILADLNICGINEMTMFPELDGLAAWINRSIIS